jgi:AmmeMemoRadiSam system protein B
LRESSMKSLRQPAVAGQFYPGEPEQLRRTIAVLLEEADPTAVLPKAIIAPHAGYIYSGPVAASAYAHLMGRSGHIQRVILIGPAHRVAIGGLAVSSAAAFATPLGPVPVDREAVSLALSLPQVMERDDAHAAEHGLEVHLPFLQEICGDFSIVPLVVGETTADEVSEVLHLLWGGAETLIVISSDLSHYLEYEVAREKDKATTRAIEALQAQRINQGDACGRIPIQGLLEVAKARGLRVTTVDQRSSGDTAGPRGQVVGYGAYLFS